MRISLKHHIADDSPVACDNCNWQGTAIQTNDIKDIEERIEPGTTVPTGECPMCGALAYIRNPDPKTESPVDTFATVLAITENMPDAQKIYIAAVEHRSGINLYAHRTNEGRQKAIAAFCREHWHELDNAGSAPEDDQVCITVYFDWHADQGNDFLTEDDMDLID